VPFTLTSPAFDDGHAIPRDFTCEGRDVSPPLAWFGEPKDTQFYALVMDDPDAPRGTWTHWTWWNLGSSSHRLSEGADPAAFGATLGLTSANEAGYHGPCPPSGVHRYVFALHALPGPLRLHGGAKVAELHAALAKHSLGKAVLTGTYQRR
jgi:Raf kinase inhibitor-like YbhB/YbcL family protein